MATDILWTGPAEAAATLVFAHGAGAPMDHPWMNRVAGLLAERDIRVARFEFDYMAARRSGGRKATPRAENATDEYRAVVDQVGGDDLFIGGKSYGGRVASLVADELHDAGMIRGLVCVGYPFHPPGSPQQLRTAHLTGIRTPTLICQGERDPFGRPDEVATYGLPSTVTVRWFADGDHGLTPRKGVTGLTELDHLTTAADVIAGFVQ